MTKAERFKQLSDKIRLETKNKKYLYEIKLTEFGQTFGTVLANSDHEAIGYALTLWPKALSIRIDDWGKGPWMHLKGDLK